MLVLFLRYDVDLVLLFYWRHTIALPHYAASFFVVIHSNKSFASCSQSAGGPLLLKRMMVCIVSFLQQGHSFGLYSCGAGLVLTGFEASGNCAVIVIAAAFLAVLLSIP